MQKWIAHAHFVDFKKWQEDFDENGDLHQSLGDAAALIQCKHPEEEFEGSGLMEICCVTPTDPI